MNTNGKRTREIESESEAESFHFIKPAVKNPALQAMFQRNREDKAAIELRVQQILRAITVDQLKPVVTSIWKKNGKFGQTRITKNDKDEALKILSRRFREEEELIQADLFLEEHRHLLQDIHVVSTHQEQDMEETLPEESIIEQSLIDLLTSTRSIVD